MKFGVAPCGINMGGWLYAAIFGASVPSHHAGTEKSAGNIPTAADENVRMIVLRSKGSWAVPPRHINAESCWSARREPVPGKKPSHCLYWFRYNNRRAHGTSTTYSSSYTRA